MKILVYAHRLEVGGTQTNAIELSAALRDLHGHDVVLFASPGPMMRLVEEKRLRFVPAPDTRFHPTPGVMRALRDVVRQERPDVIHAWDWWQCIEAYYSVHLPMRVPMVVSDMSMNVTRVLPKGLVTTWGTPQLVDQARAAGRRRVGLLLPPVDVHLNAPGAVETASLRARLGLDRSEITLVTVSRLAAYLKGESLRRTIEAVRQLGREFPLRLVIVGDGDARAELERLADSVNTDLNRRAVQFTGMMLDPRSAYAAADIVLGMGSSALRALAFGKPLIVLGEKGFAAPFTEHTAESFYYAGMYGLGDGAASNERLTDAIRQFARERDRLPALGAFSRQFALRHFSLEQVSATLAELCRQAADEKPRLSTAMLDAVRTTALYLRERRFMSASGARQVEPVTVASRAAA